MIAKRRAARAARAPGGANATAASSKPGPTGTGASLHSFRDGMQSLPLALARDGGFTVRCGATVTRVDAAEVSGVPSGGGNRPGGGRNSDARWNRSGPWLVHVDDDAEPIPADAVVLAGEPWATAPLVRGTVPELASLLDGIPCPPVGVVALGYGPEAAAQVPRGFGVLVPRGEGRRILGCLWDSRFFPGRSPEGGTLVRAMLGGAVDPAIGGLSEDELVGIVRDDLRAVMGLAATPRYLRVVRWPRAIPQYELGHPDVVRRIQNALRARPGLHVAGNALHGIAFGKAATAGKACGERAVMDLATHPA